MPTAIPGSDPDHCNAPSAVGLTLSVFWVQDNRKKDFYPEHTRCLWDFY